MNSRIIGAAACVALLGACSTPPLQMANAGEVGRFVVERHGRLDLEALTLRPEVCDGYELKPDSATLDEGHFVRFLQKQNFDVQVQRQQVDPNKPELYDVFVRVPGAAQPVPLRVAKLLTADDAGKALHDGLLVRGSGAWGVHRSNLAVLGPNGRTADDIVFAVLSKVACWGTLTIAASGEAFVVPGGYAEP
jgi:hypothetical protein